jgi:hypothetical protein
MCGFLWIFMITKLRRYMHLIDVLLMFYVCIDRFWLLYPITLVSTSQLPIHIYIYIYIHMGDRPPPGSSSSEPADAKRTRQGASRFWISVYIYVCIDVIMYGMYMHRCTCTRAMIYLNMYHVPVICVYTWRRTCYGMICPWHQFECFPHFLSIYIIDDVYIYLCMRACTHTWPCKYMHM